MLLFMFLEVPYLHESLLKTLAPVKIKCKREVACISLIFAKGRGK
jgi:hypothetical protein